MAVENLKDKSCMMCDYDFINERNHDQSPVVGERVDGRYCTEHVLCQKCLINLMGIGQSAEPKCPYCMVLLDGFIPVFAGFSYRYTDGHVEPPLLDVDTNERINNISETRAERFELCGGYLFKEGGNILEDGTAYELTEIELDVALLKEDKCQLCEQVFCNGSEQDRSPVVAKNLDGTFCQDHLFCKACLTAVMKKHQEGSSTFVINCPCCAETIVGFMPVFPGQRYTCNVYAYGDLKDKPMGYVGIVSRGKSCKGYVGQVSHDILKEKKEEIVRNGDPDVDDSEDQVEGDNVTSLDKAQEEEHDIVDIGIQTVNVRKSKKKKAKSHTATVKRKVGKPLIPGIGYFDDELQKWICQRCRRPYETRRYLMRHWREYHRLLGSHLCIFCNVSFPRKFNVDRHMKDVHKVA